jgi:spore maturation protein CgeB
MLRGQGLNVYYAIGDVYAEYRQRYNESKIALSWSSLLDTPTRVFESLAMGLPLVCNKTPDLATFFVEGEHFLGFDNAEEGRKQTIKLLADKEMREEIASAGYRKVQQHTWDSRITQILETVKLI